MRERDTPRAFGSPTVIASNLPGPGHFSQYQCREQDAVTSPVNPEHLNRPDMTLRIAGCKHIDDHAAIDHHQRWRRLSHVAA